MSRATADQSQVRIIAGRWRGRKISFPTSFSIRPTPDRVRETLFNWLAPYLDAYREVCGLDLYAGSGVLGFEALSRGAVEMVFIDSERGIIKHLETQHEVLKVGFESGVNRVSYQQSDAQAYLSAVNTKFDLVFLDPPYQQNRIPAVIDLLVDKKIMNDGGLIYFEMEKNETPPVIPSDWTLIKNKVMGQVACYLVQVK